MVSIGTRQSCLCILVQKQLQEQFMVTVMVLRYASMLSIKSLAICDCDGSFI